MFELWESKMTNKESLITGDMNIDWKRINDSEYHLKPLANILMDYVYSENLTQLMEDYTREERYRDEVRRSCIDHHYTNTPEKFTNMQAEYLGTSDHKVIKCKKNYNTKEKKANYKKKRTYKNFNTENFLNDINMSPINEETTRSSCINKAAETFNREFLKNTQRTCPDKNNSTEDQLLPCTTREH